jgi:hypothetical protein
MGSDRPSAPMARPTKPWQRAATSPLTQIDVPSRLFDATRRAATLMVSPYAVYSKKWLPPKLPTIVLSNAQSPAHWPGCFVQNRTGTQASERGALPDRCPSRQ